MSGSRADLRRIQQALRFTDLILLHGGTNYAAAKALGVPATTLARWQHRRWREGDPAWPTDAAVSAWEAQQAATATARARNAAQTAAWRRRTYLERGPLWVDATGTVRRLRALVAIGWTQLDIGAHLSVSDQYISLLTSGKHPKVHIDTRRTIAAAYDRLCMTVPTNRPAWVHDRQRRYAQKRGWAPPLAWDDIDTDPAPRGIQQEDTAA